jgi:hypothetical protein
MLDRQLAVSAAEFRDCKRAATPAGASDADGS